MRARNILEATAKYDGERYEVGLLWRENDTVLPNIYDTAKNRLLKVEKKMKGGSHYGERYCAEIQKYIDKGYARLLPDHEAAVQSPRTWYLPHFGVSNPNKPDKLRVVFDAAAVTSNVSLNGVLLKGPEHAQPLLNIIYKFRQGKIAVAADIQEMFLQIKIRRLDQDSQRFLWRDGETDAPIRTYVMQSMIFGAICSPCCAEYIKNLNAGNFIKNKPMGAKAILNEMYVDDLVKSFDSESEAENTCREAVDINANIKFNLRNFVSNSKTLQEKLNGIKEPTNRSYDIKPPDSTDKVLGMFWNTNNDTLEFQFKFNRVRPEVLSCKRSPTKRELLAIVMAIYDPFGILSNYTVYAKIILQWTWKAEITWDDLLPPELSKQWVKWWTEFQQVKFVKIKRCYSLNLQFANDVQLHIFCDASLDAYASVAYFRIKSDNKIDVAFVAAKSRCAPLKGTTVPRLELQAAVLGTRLKTTIEACHDIHIDKTYYWTDSKTVIVWVRSTTRRYKQFVACRVSEILSTSIQDQWYWLPSADNVADKATKASLPCEDKSSANWLKGPDFLLEEERFWPMEREVASEMCHTEELAKQILHTHMTSKSPLIEFTKYSSFSKMTRILAWVCRFIHNAKRRPETRQVGELVARETMSAELVVIECVQKLVYAEEINCLRHAKTISRQSSIYQLSPYLDDNRILRIRGRIDAAYCLPISARCPIIMPPNHPVTRLIVRHYHCLYHHQNDRLTINEMRQRYWVTNARAALKSIKKSCPRCICETATPSTPLMGQLPLDRLTPYVRPFSYTGVDYCGPFSITIGRRKEKRWIALFTCLTTRAVHIEVAESLSTDAFILCLRNFINRRGRIVKMRSDNGTNFIGAQRLLNKEDRLFDHEQINRELSKHNIEWQFNCPVNPNAGGCWERLIRCVKRLLNAVLREEAPRLETFRSVLIEAENIINSRPLTDLPLSKDEDDPLTPNHFLLGCLNSTQTPSNEESNICMRKQWRIAQNLKDRVWKRWVNEYLPQLLRRPKWREEAEPLKPGQLVIVCDHSQPRSQWQKGRIVEVVKAKDGQVRVATVRTNQGCLRRPASKLAALQFGDYP